MLNISPALFKPIKFQPAHFKPAKFNQQIRWDALSTNIYPTDNGNNLYAEEIRQTDKQVVMPLSHAVQHHSLY